MELQRLGRLKFYDGSKLKIGRQMINIWLSFLSEFYFDWMNGITGSPLRIRLKKHFKMAAHQVVIFSLGRAPATSSKAQFSHQECNPNGHSKGSVKSHNQIF